MEAVHGALCFSIELLQGKLSKSRQWEILLPLEAHLGPLAPAHLTIMGRLCSLRRLSVRPSTATCSCGTTAWLQRSRPSVIRRPEAERFRRLALKASASRTERLSRLVLSPISM